MQSGPGRAVGGGLWGVLSEACLTPYTAGRRLGGVGGERCRGEIRRTPAGDTAQRPVCASLYFLGQGGGRRQAANPKGSIQIVIIPSEP